MNSIIRDYYPTFAMYQALRDQLMEILTDADLAFQPGGDNPTLGELCREIGETEHSYIQSFTTFTLDFDYRHEDPTIAKSVARLSAWFNALDGALKESITALAEEDVEQKKIDRGGGFEPSLLIQLDVYKEALLIFYGKVSVYLRAMGKQRPYRWQSWIA